MWKTAHETTILTSFLSIISSQCYRGVDLQVRQFVAADRERCAAQWTSCLSCLTPHVLPGWAAAEPAEVPPGRPQPAAPQQKQVLPLYNNKTEVHCTAGMRLASRLSRVARACAPASMVMSQLLLRSEHSHCEQHSFAPSSTEPEDAADEPVQRFVIQEGILCAYSRLQTDYSEIGPKVMRCSSWRYRNQR